MVIVAAIDRSDRATDVVNEAEALATAFDDTVHVVHVLTRSEFVDLGRTKAEAGDSINMDEVRKVAADIAASHTPDVAVPTESVGLVGDPASQVSTYASDNEARYIVVAGRKRSPAGKAIFGSVAQSIILSAKCPVLSTVSTGA